MFFHQFNPLTEAEVTRKVAAAPQAKNSAAPVSSGWSFNLKFGGEFAPSQLDYVISGSALTLTVTENGTTYKDVPYGWKSLSERVILITHTIPGTSRAWHIIYDTETSLVTAFETWFGISVPVGGDMFGTRQPTHYRDIPREVQRHYHFGWAEWSESPWNGKTPEKLHTTTNRLEGRGLHWKYCCGHEVLSYFPSVVCSTSVSLDAPEDTITVTYPSDYLRINDEFFIYAKWGVEFAGEAWIEVIDMFRGKAAGLKFGFDEQDEFVYELHTAELTVTGDAAHLETITLNGDKAPPMATLTGKGARYAYRPKDMDIPMKKEEAHAKAQDKHIYDTTGPNIMNSGNTLDRNYFLVGKQFALNYDHVVTPYPWSAKNNPGNISQQYEYDIASKETLKWRAPGGAWQEEKYVCFEPAHDIYFFSHMLTGDPNFANVTQAIDFSNGLATCIFARVGSWTSEWEIGATCLFGTASGEGIATPPFSKRHDFTTDLVGKSYAWAYSDTMCSVHVYSSPESYSWTIFQDDNSGGATWSSPCFYIKLRDDAYIFQWVEENCNGSQGIMCFNPQIMHDGGFFFNVGHNGLMLNVTGAYARSLGTFNVKPYFDKKGNI
ncbi:MAG: hypothetical protein LBN99_05850 [Oscillospiraceae bacterium]|jgi:hypothetical protein|nr:hypothetical protein [Oscillospiraceae bacterium]